MERPLLPTYLCRIFSDHLNQAMIIPVVIPNGVLPMDMYNTLYKMDNIRCHLQYGWITTRGRNVAGNEAAELALEANLLDTKVKWLTVEDYPGSWRRK